MKKILSILLTVTMVFTFVASFRVPTASAAAPTQVKLSDTSKLLTTTNPLRYFNDAPGTPATSVGDLIKETTTYYVYNMGDVIHGYLADATGAVATAPTVMWTVTLRYTNGAVVDTVNVSQNTS